jgi:hypothetical protein
VEGRSCKGSEKTPLVGVADARADERGDKTCTEDQYGLFPAAPLTVGTAGSGAGVLLVFPPLGFSSLGLGISFGGMVPVPGVVPMIGGPLIVAAPQGSQVGPQPQCFFEPQRAFRLSKRFGRHEMLVGQQVGAGAQVGAHTGAGWQAGAQAGAHPQDFLPNPPMRDLSLSKMPGLELPQQVAGAPQSPHPAPLTTNGAAGGGGGGAASAPASTADDMIRNAAFTAATSLRVDLDSLRVTTHHTNRRGRSGNVKPV